jgi:hypothetical protein
MEQYDWISHTEMNRRVPIDTTAKIDPEISHIVGQPVRVNDPRLVQLVVKWKNKMNYDPDGTLSYNFTQQSGFVEDLKQIFKNA